MTPMTPSGPSFASVNRLLTFRINGVIRLILDSTGVACLGNGGVSVASNISAVTICSCGVPTNCTISNLLDNGIATALSRCGNGGRLAMIS